MSAIRPTLSVLFAVIATAVPWGLPADATFILPLVVIMMVFCWRALPGVTLSPVVAMLLGLLTDVMSGGPLGFWALLALIASSAGARSRTFGAEHDLGPLWVIWTGLVAGMACFGWLLASAFLLRWVDWWPITVGTAASVALFPVVLNGLLWIKQDAVRQLPRASYRRRV